MDNETIETRGTNNKREFFKIEWRKGAAGGVGGRVKGVECVFLSGKVVAYLLYFEIVLYVEQDVNFAWNYHCFIFQKLNFEK